MNNLNEMMNIFYISDEEAKQHNIQLTNDSCGNINNPFYYNNDNSNYTLAPSGNYIYIYPTLQDYFFKTVTLYKSPEETTKDHIFEIIKKIIDGGKKQLIFSVKSEDNLEKEIAQLFIMLAAKWHKEQEEQNKRDGEDEESSSTICDPA